MASQDIPQKISFSSALVLGLNEDSTRLDRRFLVQAGVPEVHITASVRKALVLLSEQSVDLILLDRQATNINWFMDALQKICPEATPPVVLISQGADEESVLEAIGTGCSGVLLRPYSMNAFLTQMHRASQGIDAQAMAVAASLSRRVHLHRTQEAEAKEAQAEARTKSSSSVASSWLQKGRQCLSLQSYQEAVEAFKRASNCPECTALAYIGLSLAWAGLGKSNRADQFRYQAAEHALQYDNTQALEALHEDYKPHQAKETFVHVGFCLVRTGQTLLATKAFAQAARYDEDMEAVLPAVTRACSFTDNPPAMAKKMASALARTFGERSPAFYLQRIEGQRSYISIQSERELSSKAVKAFSDVWAVLKYTCIAYAKGGFGHLPAADPETGRLPLKY